MAKKSLGEIVADTRKITISGDDYIEVRGLSMADLTTLFKRHTDPLTRAFDDLMDSRPPGQVGFAMEELQSTIHEALTSAPTLVGDIIATAMDQPDHGRDAAKLRAGVQINALLAIAELSITTEAELKNVVGAVTKVITNVTALFQAAQKTRQAASLSSNGSGAFGNA